MLERRKIMDLITYKGCLLIFLLRLPGDTIRVVGNIVFWRTVCGWEQFFFLILGEYMTFLMIL